MEHITYIGEVVEKLTDHSSFPELFIKYEEGDPILNNALQREKPQFIVIYGRRRIGKSKLIREIMDWKRKDIYFLSDQTNEANQRMLFAKTATMVGMEDFDKVTYPDWETLLRALNRQVAENSTVCLDEFPYLVKSCPSLPSVIQKLLNERSG